MNKETLKTRNYPKSDIISHWTESVEQTEGNVDAVNYVTLIDPLQSDEVAVYQSQHWASIGRIWEDEIILTEADWKEIGRKMGWLK